ncbi:HAMP domain-containing protein, partial [bacterium]
ASVQTQHNPRPYHTFCWSKTAFQDNIPFLLDDRRRLQSWPNRVQEEGFNQNDFQSTMVRETLDFANTLVTRTQPIYVLDPELNILAVAPNDPSLIGQAFKPRALLDVSMEAALESAQSGSKIYSAQSVITSDGTRLVAFPLRKSDADPVVAIVVYRLRPVGFPTPTNMELYQTFFLIMMAIMFIIALPVGALFGWVVTRGLRKRLATLSAASKAWSRGDFNVAPQDQAGDEIGELTRNLNGMAEQLEALLHTRDELARVEERNRLARDLHDTVKQQTYAARMQLSAAKNLLTADPQAAGALVESALQLNRETQQELTLIIDELRPAALQGKGLAQALKEYVERWQMHTGIQVATAVSGERTLPLEVEEALYRVLQESLANVARHAAA